MPFLCAKCGANLDSIVSTNAQVARSESCISCKNDLHSCIQCANYDIGAYNSCREPQAERVLDKERSNFCDHFKKSLSFNKTQINSLENQKAKALSELDALFKK